MADYWRGGWAEQGGMLPGTAAAMTAKNAGGSYGPLNALADILGAYWQKRSKDKVNEAVDKFEAGFDADMAPAPQWQAPSVMDGLMSAQGLQEAQAPQMVAAGAPLSISEYSAQAKGKKAKLMRDLTRKYGYGAVQDILPAVDEVINGKILGYANSSRDKIYDDLREASLETLPGLLKQVDEYNGVVSPIGGSPIDIKGLLQNFAMKAGNVDLGGQMVQQVSANNGLPIRYKPVVNKDGKVTGYAPEYVQTIGSMPKSMSPSQIAQKELAEEKFKWQKNNDIANYNLKAGKYAHDAWIAEETLKNKKKYADARIAAGWNNGSGSGGKLSQSAQGAANSIKDAVARAKADIESGAVSDPSNHSVRELHELIEDAIEKGYAKGDDVDLLRNLDYEMNFLFNKATGNEDTAYEVAKAITPEYWQARLGGYGKQPS